MIDFLHLTHITHEVKNVNVITCLMWKKELQMFKKMIFTM